MKGNFEIKVDEKYIISQLQNGVQMNTYYSPDLDAYALNMAKRGWKLWNGDGRLHAEVKELTINEFLLVMSLDSGEVEYFTPYVKISEADINNEVLEGLPNRTYPAYTDPSDEENPIEVPERVKTWNEWLLNYSMDGVQGNYTATLIDGFWYYNVNGIYKGLQYMTGSELMLIHNSVDAELVDEVPTIEEII